MTTPDIGTKAPIFTLPRDGGGTVSLKDFKGKNVVLFFYPKDNTPGCTIEACDFNKSLKAFDKIDTVVIGISKDSVKKHDKFKENFGLKFILASDEATDICEQYGVYIEKSMYGKKYMGIERTTFLIDGAGKIAHVWNKVKIIGHVDDVMAAVKTL